MSNPAWWRRSKTGMRIRPWTSCARPSGKCCKKELPVMVPPCKDPPAFLYHAGIWKMHGGTVTIVWKKMKNMVDIFWVLYYTYVCDRGVAQFGRALRSGRRGRKFESCRLDSKAWWSSGQDDALSRRKPGFDSRSGHLLLQSCCSSIFTRCFLGSVGRATHS